MNNGSYKKIFTIIILLALVIITVGLYSYHQRSITTEFAKTLPPHQDLQTPDKPTPEPAATEAHKKQPNYYLNYLAVKLLLSVEQGEDFSEIITDFNKLKPDAFIIEKIKELSVAKSISLLQLLDELIQLDFTPQTVTFNSKNQVMTFILNNKLLDKLFIVKKRDPKSQQQLALARKYLSNRQLDLAILSMSELAERQEIADWLRKAKNTEKIQKTAQDIAKFLTQS
jgi:hypothetical protein